MLRGALRANGAVGTGLTSPTGRCFPSAAEVAWQSVAARDYQWPLSRSPNAVAERPHANARSRSTALLCSPATLAPTLQAEGALTGVGQVAERREGAFRARHGGDGGGSSRAHVSRGTRQRGADEGACAPAAGET
jgi:hypothetical protein